MERSGSFEGRPDADTPVRAVCEVLSRRREGAYWHLSFSAREIAERARAGQFVNVAVGSTGSLLRRPFSIARVSRKGPFAGTVDIVFDAHGPGTEWLTTVAAHDHLDVVGPLGTPFPLPQRKVGCLLVGGGYGTAPLLFLSDELSRTGLRVDMVVGAATKARLFDPIETKRSSASITFTTEDGSHGVTGRVTDVLAEAAAACRAGVVYACGPNPMLRAVSERCAELGLPVQVAVEERMGCGIGVCFTCVLPIRTRSGEVQMRRSCLDGPVFNGARIAWEQTRYGAAPGDTSWATTPLAGGAGDPAREPGGAAAVSGAPQVADGGAGFDAGHGGGGDVDDGYRAPELSVDARVDPEAAGPAPGTPGPARQVVRIRPDSTPPPATGGRA